jgi:hypothetical protein
MGLRWFATRDYFVDRTEETVMIQTLVDSMQHPMQHPMTGTEEAPFAEQSLVDENAILRTIIVELLIKNQKLRGATQTYSYQAAAY